MRFRLAAGDASCEAVNTRSLRPIGRSDRGEKAALVPEGKAAFRLALSACAGEQSLAEGRNEAPEQKQSIATHLLRKLPAEVLENLWNLASQERACLYNGLFFERIPCGFVSPCL